MSQVGPGGDETQLASWKNGSPGYRAAPCVASQHTRSLGRRSGAKMTALEWLWLGGSITGTAAVAWWFRRRAREINRETPLAEIQLMPWIRIPMLLVLALGGIGSVAMILLPFFPGAWQADPDIPAAAFSGMGLGLFFTFLAFRELIRTMKIVVTPKWLCLGGTFVPWREVRELRLSDWTLRIAGPRRWWNVWLGRADYPMWFYQRDADQLSRLMDFFRSRSAETDPPLVI